MSVATDALKRNIARLKKRGDYYQAGIFENALNVVKRAEKEATQPQSSLGIASQEGTVSRCTVCLHTGSICKQGRTCQ